MNLKSISHGHQHEIGIYRMSFNRSYNDFKYCVIEKNT